MSSTPARVLAAAVGVAVVGSLLVAAPGAASQNVSESYAVPANGVLRISGHGYGHGHGMSQYGAWGAAKRGLSARQIVAFYYPRTAVGTATGPIRVLVSADIDNDVRVLPASGLKVRRVSTGATYALPATAGIKTWRLRTVGGNTVLDYDNGAWRTYRPGGTTLVGDAEFARNGPLTLRVAGGTRAYRGALRLSGGNTVNVLPLDSYVRGVVAREMPASWTAAAVQAQAIAARTYAAFDRAAHSTRSWHTCDTTSCQVYGGLSSEHPLSNAAVTATANQVLRYGGRLAFTQFSSSSGGWLSAGSQPYLVAKADPYDGHSSNPMHDWSTTLTRSAVQAAYPSLGTLKRVLVTRRNGHGDWAGRVEAMVLDGSRGNVSLSGNSFRSRFRLRSDWFRFGTAPASQPTQPAPTPAPATQSAITLRWKAIGGASSVVGRPTSSEYAVGSGRARRFQHGRIYAKAGIGARELHGRVLRAYLRRGAATSWLGFPRTAPRRYSRGVYADFEHGILRVRRSGKVVVVRHPF